MYSTDFSLKTSDYYRERLLIRLALMPVGGSRVILMEFCRTYKGKSLEEVVVSQSLKSELMCSYMMRWQIYSRLDMKLEAR